MIVLDSSAVIELMAGTSKGNMIRNYLEKDSAAVVSISINEILIGLKGRQRDLVHAFLKDVSILPFDEEASYKSVEIEDLLRARGTLVGKLDIFIAAVCMTYTLPILTADYDFKKIPGLRALVV